MKTYPSIPGVYDAPIGRPCKAFIKYDGSNLRFEWSKKRGFYKFGTRTRLFDKSDEIFGGAIDLFNNEYAEAITEVILYKLKGIDKVTVFMEYFGPGSFAGSHDLNSSKELKLFDIHVHPRGIIGPGEFLEIFAQNGRATLPFTAELVYDGNFNKEFIADVKSGKFPLPEGCEGVVAKGGAGHNLWMAKVKTDAFIARLKEKFQQKWEDYV